MRFIRTFFLPYNCQDVIWNCMNRNYRMQGTKYSPLFFFILIAYYLLAMKLCCTRTCVLQVLFVQLYIGKVHTPFRLRAFWSGIWNLTLRHHLGVWFGSYQLFAVLHNSSTTHDKQRLGQVEKLCNSYQQNLAHTDEKISLLNIKASDVPGKGML